MMTAVLAGLLYGSASLALDSPLAKGIGLTVHRQLTCTTLPNGVRGVVTNEDLPMDTLLMSVPLSSCVAVPRGVDDDKELAEALLDATRTIPAWTEYRDKLMPSAKTNAAMLWTEDEIAELQLPAACELASELRERYEELNLGDESPLKKMEISRTKAYQQSDLVKTHLVVSHRWLEPTTPDVGGEQLRRIREHLVANPQFEWVWYDCACSPSGSDPAFARRSVCADARASACDPPLFSRFALCMRVRRFQFCLRRALNGAGMRPDPPSRKCSRRREELSPREDLSLHSALLQRRSRTPLCRLRRRRSSCDLRQLRDKPGHVLCEDLGPEHLGGVADG